MKSLSNVYNRWFWGAYFLGKKLGGWTDSSGSKANKEKIYLGKSKNYFSKLQVGEYEIERGLLKVGDEIMVTRPSLGVIEFRI